MLIRSGKCSCECQSPNSERRSGETLHHMATAAFPKSDMPIPRRILPHRRPVAADRTSRRPGTLDQYHLSNYKSPVDFYFTLRSYPRDTTPPPNGATEGDFDDWNDPGPQRTQLEPARRT